MIETVYKLTDNEDHTRRGQAGDTRWGANVFHEARGWSRQLCTDGLIHWYDFPEMAVLMNPIHAGITCPICWESYVASVDAHDGTKGGSRSLTTCRLVPLPTLSAMQRAEIAIRLVLGQCSDDAPRWAKWAARWLDGSDRSAGAAEAEVSQTQGDKAAFGDVPPAFAARGLAALAAARMAEARPFELAAGPVASAAASAVEAVAALKPWWPEDQPRRFPLAVTRIIWDVMHDTWGEKGGSQ